MSFDPQFTEAIYGLTLSLKTKLAKINPRNTYLIHEVRIRLNSPICVTIGSTSLFVGIDGVLHKKPNINCAIASQEEIEASFVSLCNYSVHTHQQEISKGYISLAGGHRVGLGATAVYQDGGNIKNVRAVTSYVIRISRSFQGVATPVIEQILLRGLRGVLIVGPPSSGKTSILCDLAVQLSKGTISPSYAVAVVDERGEISPRLGINGGMCCEVLAGYSKSDGIISAVRALAPNLIICDEVGGKEDVDSIMWALNCGVPIITTIHGRSFDEIMRRPTGRLLLESGAFDYMVVLEGADTPCKIKEVISLDEHSNMGKANRDYVYSV